MIDACLDCGNCLTRETLQLFGVLIEVLSPFSACNAACLAGVGLADHGVVFCHREHLFFVSVTGVSFMSGDELGANPYRNLSVHCIDHLWHESHRGNSACVAACFGSLCHDEVATTGNCSNSVTDFSAHGTNKNVVLMEFVDDFARNTEACHINTGSTFDDRFQVAFDGIRGRSQEVNSKWLLGHFAHTSHFGNEKFCAHWCCTKRADAACF